MVEVVFGIVVAGMAVLGYVERRALKAELNAVKANALRDVAEAKSFVKTEAGAAETGAIVSAEKLNEALKGYGAQIRAKISADVSKVIADAKAEAEKLETEVKAEVSKAVAKMEADIRKVL